MKVVLHNFGKEWQNIKRNQKIAQLILEKAAIPEITPVTNLNTTDRGQGGFGSTDSNQQTQKPMHTKITTLPPPVINKPQHMLPTSTTAAAAKLNADLNIAFEVLYLTIYICHQTHMIIILVEMSL